MYEKNVATKVEWSALTKRDQELQGIKVEETWKLDPSTGLFKKEKNHDGSEADLKSDLRLKYALTRRSLAMDQTLLMSFEPLESWCDDLISHRFRKPPEGYAQVA